MHELKHRNKPPTLSPLNSIDRNAGQGRQSLVGEVWGLGGVGQGEGVHQISGWDVAIEKALESRCGIVYVCESGIKLYYEDLIMFDQLVWFQANQ